MNMNYPLISEYIEAVMSAEDNFNELSDLRLVLDDGQPVMSSGNFAVVFKMRDEQTGKLHAVKCFLKDQEGRAEAYRLIAEELEFVNSTYLTPIRYLERELFVDTNNSDETEFPVLQMDWVDGLTLDKYIREHIDCQYDLAMLAYQFSRLAMWLMPQPFAHGDLKPDNILVKKDGSLVLVDYDSMYVPELDGWTDEISGLAGYQHPARWNNKYLSPKADYFSELVIYTSIKVLAETPSLWDDLMIEDTDTMIFTAEDIKSGGASPIFNIIESTSTCNYLSKIVKEFLSKNSIDELEPLENVIVSPIDKLGDQWRDNGYRPSPSYKESDIKRITNKW